MTLLFSIINGFIFLLLVVAFWINIGRHVNRKIWLPGIKALVAGGAAIVFVMLSNRDGFALIFLVLAYVLKLDWTKKHDAHV